MEWQDLVPVASAVVAATGVTIALSVRKIADMRLAQELHKDLTTGEVAKARDKVTVYLTTTPSDPDAADLRQAWFTLLWAFERVEAGRNLLLSRYDRRLLAKRDRVTGPVKYLDGLVSRHVHEWSTGLDGKREELEQKIGNVALGDDHSVRALQRLSQSVPSPRVIARRSRTTS